MYGECLYCAAPFGANDAIEGLPVGRRLAFDGALGRLWVVCRLCGRWNLTPLDERWEALEQCERGFRDTRVRISSDNIGLARLRDGTELVRIGKPLRTEFAAWRYGSQFLRRHRHRLILAIARLGRYAADVNSLGQRPALRIPFDRGEELCLTMRHVMHCRLVPDDSADGWALMLHHLPEPASLRSMRLMRRFAEPEVELTGIEARRAAMLILPTLNALGGTDTDISEAVRWIELSGGPQRSIASFARSGLVRPPLASRPGPVRSMHTEVRLALEMALHEEEERRAVDGELSALDLMWRHEERLAAIADRLGLPVELEDQLEALRRRVSSPTPG
jgi:hypothetical protein